MSEFDGLRLAASQVSGGSCCFDAGKPGHKCPRFVAVPAADIPALLNRLEAAEAAVARVRAILDAWEAWDGSLGSDGRTHPDASSPRDRERLRAALASDDEAGIATQAPQNRDLTASGPESGQRDHCDDEGRSGARDGSGA